VPADAYDRIVAGVRADHDERYGCRSLLARVFGDRIEIIVIGHDTRGPADTVAHLVREARVTGAVAVKDADSFFEPAPLPQANFVSVSDIRKTPEMSNVGAKSFAVINEDGVIVEMVEKSLASNHVCIGLYGFSEAGRFLDAFGAVARAHEKGEIYVSHVMNRAILDGMIVVPHAVSGLIDVGTLEDWRRHVRTRGTIVTDLDGVVFKNHSRHFPPYWDDADEPIEANISALLDWQSRGAQLIFMTARPEEYRARVTGALQQLGLHPHALIMDCRHGRRFLINDHAESNPHPSAVAISIERDSGVLGSLLRDWR
jgi:hypothetical protein